MVVGLWVRAAADIVQNVLHITGKNAVVDCHKFIIIVAGVDARAILALEMDAFSAVHRHGGNGGAATVLEGPNVLLGVSVVGGINGWDVAVDFDLES